MAKADYKIIHPASSAAWRKWLASYHDKSPGVWIATWRKESGKPRPSYESLVEEALCYGWIDSLKKVLDTERSIQLFTPRKPKSVWSDINKKRVTTLTTKGKMTEAGLQTIRVAKKNGSWNALKESGRHAAKATVPKDLAAAFTSQPAAFKNFLAFAPSYRKQFLSWIDAAKKPETRTKRIAQTVLMSSQNRKPGPAGFK